MSTKRYLLLTVLLLLVVVFASHGRSVWGGYGFVNYDDHDVVRDNARFMQSPGSAIFDIVTERTFFSWQPLYFLSLYLDHGIAKALGLGSGIYHFHNVLLHLINALLVVLIVLHLSRDRRIALAAGVAFAVMPGLTESVAWVSSRKDVLSFALMGLSLLLALKSARADGTVRIRPYVVSLILFALSLTAKGTTLVLPFLLVAHTLLARRNDEDAPHWLSLLKTAPFFVVAAVLTLVHYLVALAGDVAGAADSGVVDLLVADAGVFARYVVTLVAMPFQTVAHQVTLGQFDAWTILGLLLLAAGVFAIIRTRKSAPLVALGILWFILALAPFNNVLPRTSTLMAERYLYIPALGGALALAWLVTRFSQGSFPLVLAVVAILLGGQTFVRTGIWADSKTLWEDAVRKAPTSWLAQQKLGECMAGARNHEAARTHFELALAQAETTGQEVRTHADLATVFLALERPADSLAAMLKASESLEALPDRDAKQIRLHINLTGGKAAEILGQFDAALASYRDAAKIAPDDPRGPFNEGTLLLKLGRHENAERALEDAVRRAERAHDDSTAANALLNLTSLHLGRRAVAAAEETLARAVALGADEGAVTLRRARILRQKGKVEEAYALLEREAGLRPSDTSIPRAISLFRQEEARAALGDGDPKKALESARQAVTWNGSDAGTRMMLARVLRANGRFEEALVETEAVGRRVAAGAAPEELLREQAEILTLIAARELAAAEEEKAADSMRRALDVGSERLDAGGMVLDGRLLRLARGTSGESARPVLLGLVDLAIGDARKGRERFELAAESGDDALAAVALAARGAALASSGLIERSIASLREAVTRAPASADIRLLLAEVLEMSGDPVAARAEFDAVAKERPDLLEAVVGSARNMGRQGLTIEALAKLNDLATKHPDRAEVHRAIAEVYLERYAATSEKSLLEGAAKELTKAINADPSDAHSLTRFAQVVSERGRVNEAIVLLRRALELRPNLESARIGLATLYVRAGSGHLEKGRLDQAEGLARRAAVLAPQDAEALLLRGKVSQARKSHAAARRDFEEARRIARDSDGPVDALADWHKAHGYRLLLGRKREEAHAAFRIAIALEPENVDLEAIKILLKTEEDRKSMVAGITALLTTAQDNLNAGDVKGAMSCVDAALRIRKRSARALFLKARIHQTLGQNAEAATAYEKALEYEPGMAGAALNLGSMAFYGGRQEDALRYYRMYLENVDPKSPGAAEQIALVGSLVKRLRERIEKTPDDGD
jgi:protein O-mannosyl-transferase